MCPHYQAVSVVTSQLWGRACCLHGPGRQRHCPRLSLRLPSFTSAFSYGFLLVSIFYGFSKTLVCDHEPHEALIRYSTGCFSMPGFKLPSGAGDPWRDHCVSDQVRCPRLPRFHGISWNLMDPLANSKQKSL